jgi:hypothetical protein
VPNYVTYDDTTMIKVNMLMPYPVRLGKCLLKEDDEVAQSCSSPSALPAFAFGGVQRSPASRKRCRNQPSGNPLHNSPDFAGKGNEPTLRAHLEFAGFVAMKVAIEHIKRMPGGAQSHLIRCDDGEYYVVKFQNNPQSKRILANEMLGTRLAARMGISMPEMDTVDVGLPLIKRTPELIIQMGIGSLPCAAGKQCGSRYPVNPFRAIVYNTIPDRHLNCVINIKDFLGIFAFDKWTCNTDRRQAVIFRQPDSYSGDSPCYFQVSMIDQGFCFDGGNWKFPDAPKRSFYVNTDVYLDVTSLESFEPWLDRLENKITLSMLWEDAEAVPIEWLDNNLSDWRKLIEHLYARRTRVRELIWSARNVSPRTFPNWITSACPMGAAISVSQRRVYDATR